MDELPPVSEGARPGRREACDLGQGVRSGGRPRRLLPRREMAALHRALVPQRLWEMPGKAREGCRRHAEGDPLAGGQGGRQGEGRPRDRKATGNEAGDYRQICRGECRGDLVVHGLSSRALAQDRYKQRSGEDHEGDPPAAACRRQFS